MVRLLGTIIINLMAHEKKNQHHLKPFKISSNWNWIEEGTRAFFGSKNGNLTSIDNLFPLGGLYFSISDSDLICALVCSLFCLYIYLEPVHAKRPCRPGSNRLLEHVHTWRLCRPGSSLKPVHTPTGCVEPGFLNWYFSFSCSTYTPDRPVYPQ